MKKFGFIKKVTAAATAAAMVASFGISAFAAAPNTNPGDGIAITDVTVKARMNGENIVPGIYDVKVAFTTSVDNTIGMTMLTYGDSENDTKLNGTDWGNNKYQSGMKIIGVDQIPGVAKDGTGEFNFSVTTEGSGSDIYLAEGKTALVALSGDGVDVPAVAELKMPVAPWTATAVSVTNTNLGEIEIVNGVNGTEDAKKEAILSNIGSVTVTDGASKTAVVTMDKSYISLTETGATITIPNGATVTADNGATVMIPNDGLSADITVTFAQKAFDVTTMTLKAGSENLTGLTMTNGYKLEDVQSEIEQKLTDVVVTGADGSTETWTKPAVVVSGTPADDTTVAFTVTVTAPADAKGNIPSGFTYPTVNVTAAADLTNVVASIKAFKDDKEVFSVTVDNGTALEDAVAGITVKAYNKESTELETGKWDLDWTCTGYNATVAGDYTATGTIKVKTGETVTATGYEGKTVSVTITVKEVVSTIAYGDPAGGDGIVIGDGEINISDVIYVFEHQYDDEVNEQNKRSDVYKDGEINITDVINVFNKQYVDLDETGFPIIPED